MVTNHDPLSVTVEDGEVVVSVFNVDTYDSARVRLGPEEARARVRELRDAVGALVDDEGSGAVEASEKEPTDAPRSQMGVPRGGPSATPFQA